MRIATWNVNSLKARIGRVEEWLADMQPDVLCMQETKLSDEAFPALTFMGLGYETAHRVSGCAELCRPASAFLRGVHTRPIGLNPPDRPGARAWTVAPA